MKALFLLPLILAPVAQAEIREIQISPGSSILIDSIEPVRVSCSGEQQAGYNCFLQGGCGLSLGYKDSRGRWQSLRDIDGLCGSPADYRKAKAILLKKGKELLDNGFCARFTDLSP